MKCFRSPQNALNLQQIEDEQRQQQQQQKQQENQQVCFDFLNFQHPVSVLVLFNLVTEFL